MDHFAERLRDATSWIDRYPGFKIGLDKEAHVYDYIAVGMPPRQCAAGRNQSKWEARRVRQPIR